MEIVHSNILGAGRPLLILHGYFGISDNWKSFGKRMAENFEVHLIDQRNHGRSFHRDEFDYELLVEDLYNYIQAKNLDEVTIMGHSMGGKVAMFFGITFPELVDKLIIADIAPRYYSPHHEQILTALNSVDFIEHTTRKKVEEVLKKHIKDIGIIRFLLKNVYWKSKDELAYRFNLESLTDNNHELGDALPSFSHFDGPALFLKGENSNYIKKSDLSLILTHFANAKVVTVKNAGHWIHTENPEQFYNEIVRFLT